MSTHRQLAVIMFTDIVGYIVLMGRDEQKACAFLNKNGRSKSPSSRHITADESKTSETG